MYTCTSSHNRNHTVTITFHSIEAAQWHVNTTTTTSTTSSTAVPVVRRNFHIEGTHIKCGSCGYSTSIWKFLRGFHTTGFASTNTFGTDEEVRSYYVLVLVCYSLRNTTTTTCCKKNFHIEGTHMKCPQRPYYLSNSIYDAPGTACVRDYRYNCDTTLLAFSESCVLTPPSP